MLDIKCWAISIRFQICSSTCRYYNPIQKNICALSAVASCMYVCTAISSVLAEWRRLGWSVEKGSPGRESGAIWESVAGEETGSKTQIRNMIMGYPGWSSKVLFCSCDLVTPLQCLGKRRLQFSKVLTCHILALNGRRRVA